jgi:Tfp pilus assembly protein PilN
MPFIRINLLPPEARQAESTPLPRFLVTAGGAALGASLFFCILWVFLVGVPGQNRLKETKQDLLSQQRAVARQADILQARIDDLKRRATTVEMINRSRVLWAPQLDWLCDLLPEDIWLTTLSVTEPRTVSANKGPALGPVVTLKVYCSSTDETRVANLLKSIQTHPKFTKDYLTAEWTTITKDDTKGGEVLTFALKLVMKPPVVPEPDKKKASAAKPAVKATAGSSASDKET